MPKKLLTWLIVAFAVFYILTEPASAASAVRGAAEGAERAGRQVVTFFTALA
ncbi:MAG: hypothetical protein M3P91_02535 [Actinomycetota bacterium]|nr:hypothetical protein [Actinomycetota bacterium]